MPWGNKSTGHNESGQSEAAKKAQRRIQADVNAEAKRRVQKVRKAGKYDGNGKAR